MKVVVHPWWVVPVQILASTAAVFAGLGIAASLSMLIDWITE